MQPNTHNCVDAALGQHLPLKLSGDGMQLADVSASTRTGHTVVCTHPSPTLLQPVTGGARLRLTLQILRLHLSPSIISSGPCPENISAGWA